LVKGLGPGSPALIPEIGTWTSVASTSISSASVAA